MELNIRHLFVITVGSAIKCRETISEMYKRNEKHYYELYINSDMYDDLLKRTLHKF